LLLHGGGQARYSWGGTAAALADRGFLTLALDARGHGESDWAPDGDYSIEALAGLQAPVLLVRGGISEVVGEEDVAAFHAVAPQAEYVDVPDAAHMVAGDRNDVFTGAVADFLGRHRSPDTR
jgi:pimeloyl-ACP methyl ester carboxylesterase